MALNIKDKATDALAREVAELADEMITEAVNTALAERNFAWLNKYRRLAKEWENPTHFALAFLRLDSIRLMLRKLCKPA